MPLQPWQSVADVGCGPGYFTLVLAERLPQGRVIAIDVDREFLEVVARKAGQAGLNNIAIVRNRGYTLPLPATSLDGALIAFVLHDLKYPSKMLNSLAPALKPGAWLAVVEWVKREEDKGPKASKRLDPHQVTAMASSVGFHPQGELVLLSERHYLLLFRKA